MGVHARPVTKSGLRRRGEGKIDRLGRPKSGERGVPATSPTLEQVARGCTSAPSSRSARQRASCSEWCAHRRL